MTAVIGAGPAGLSAALFLSGHGDDVVVIDRFSDEGYGRYHSICGAGISEGAFRDLEFIAPSHIRNDIRFAELHFPGDTVVTMKVRGYVIDRVAFLRELKERCMAQGCEFIRSEVRRIERSDGGFDIYTDGGVIRADKIIGCDGAHSVVRKCLFGTRPQMVPVEEFVTEGQCDRYIVKLGERYRGLYEWRFPSGDNVSIGSGKGMMSVEGYISKGARDIPFGGVGRISDGGAYLCGDAAGMANPVSFGGLRAALNSGQEAAREIITGTSYQKWWDRNILSNKRFMWFRDRLMEMTDDELERMARPVSKGNLYLRGVLSGIKHPSYVPMYIGCLKTFSRSW